MPKAKSKQPRWLPDWKNEPLTFIVPPDEALQRGAMAKPKKSWGKVITTGRKSRR